MKFLFDAHHLGHHQTGNETWSRNVIRAIEGLGSPHEIEYAVTPRGLPELRRISQAPAHILAGRSLWRLGIEVPRIARAIRSDAVFATYSAPLTRRPIVLAIHDVASWHSAARQWLPLLTLLQYRTTVRVSAPRAAHVLALSATAKRDLVEKVGVSAERISVAPAAVDYELGRLLRCVPPRRDCKDVMFRVLAVGNILPRKNLVVLAEAVLACRQMGAPMELRIVGAVPKDGEWIARAMRDMLGPHVQMTGYVSQPQLAAEYRAAAVLGFPSLLEGFGVPVIEAMAAGTPVVVSDASALPEVAGGSALVRPAGDVGGWRDALLRIYQDRCLRDQLRWWGWRRAAQFSWHRTAATLLEQMSAASARRGG